LYASLSVAVVSAQTCNVQQITPAKFKPEVDRVMWGHDPVALIEGVSFADKHQKDWAGPVVSVKLDGSERCRADVENLRPPFVLANGRYFYFVTADAIDFQISALDLMSCQVVWKSRTHDWYEAKGVRYHAGNFFVDQKKYRIPNDCLIKARSRKEKMQ
jgi:hypothetical protein